VKQGSSLSSGEPQAALHGGYRDNADTSVAASQSAAAVSANITAP